MARDGIDPSDQIPEADLLAQQTPLDTQPLTEPASEILDSSADPVDEADRLEQRTLIPDEDDYPHQL